MVKAYILPAGVENPQNSPPTAATVMTWYVTVGRPGITTAMMWHQLNSALYGGGRLRRPKA